jgi:hypothetical protein
MTVLELLAKWGLSAGPVLVKALQWLVDNVPDEAAAAQKALDELSAALTPESLAVLGTTVITELGNIGQFKFDGRKHPSDLG